MKKILRLIPMLLACVAATAMWSCSDDKDEPVSSNELPAVAKTFLNTYYPSVKVVSTQKDKDEYDVTLANGHSVDFNKNGEWTDVDAPAGETVPTGFYPSAIDTYINESAGGYGINEISREGSGFEVELVTGLDLLFNNDGAFIGYDI